MTDDDKERRGGPLRRITRGMGRSATAVAIPWIMLGYPVFGFLLGLFIQKTFNAPSWVPIVIMMLALVEAFREVFRIATRIEAEGENREENGK
jgi:F0F1-type ATP synthase assembly protein I